MRISHLLASLASVLAIASTADAYPQYIALGSSQCAGCHFSPTGGGLPTSMGYSAIEAVFPDVFSIDALKRFRATAAKNDPTGRTREGAPVFQGTLGFDSRLLFLRSSPEVGDDPEWVAIPMLLEAGGVIALGPVSLYATVTPVKRSTETYMYGIASREHWLSFELDDANALRVGRMVVPFGLRVPDHTLYTREDFGFNKFDQSYGLSWDRIGDEIELHLAAFAGDLWMDPPALQERAVAGSVAWSFLDDRLSVGVSALFGMSSHSSRPAASLFVRARPLGSTYVVAEVSGQRKLYSAVPLAASSAAGFLRVGWFPHASTDLYAEISGRAIRGSPELTKLRYQFGLNSHLLPWVELAPAVVLEEDVETGLKASFLGQLHVFY